MTVIAAILADLDVTPLGTRSRLCEPLGGVPILRRTVERAGTIDSVEGIFVLVPTDQRAACVDLLSGTPANVVPFDSPTPLWRSLIRAPRKWSLDAWRGGIGGTTSFDEYCDCALLKGLLETQPADSILLLPPSAPLFDPQMAQAMIEHKIATREESQFTFCQAPPGVAGIVLDAPLIKELGSNGVPIGWLMSYKPDDPQKDLIFQPCCFEIPHDLRYALGRLMADTDASFLRVSELFAHDQNPPAEAIGVWLRKCERQHQTDLPRELEIELTTDDPFPATIYRPRGNCVRTRGPIDLSLVESLGAQMGQVDDSLVVLGGFGDPLRHPDFAGVLAAITGSGSANGRRPYGLAVRTAGVDLTDDVIDALVHYKVDVLCVTLDAWTCDLHAATQSPNGKVAATLDDVLGKLEKLAQVRQERTSVPPLVVPEFTKTQENVHELDDFYDGWTRRLGAVSIIGYSHFAGQLRDRSVIRMAPPKREPCRRIASRCLVLADGRMPVCDQDFNAAHLAGDAVKDSLETIWRGDRLTQLRKAHACGSFDVNPLCKVCEEWHRP